MEGGAGQHFVPASLLPYGGFGDPETPAPYWKAPRSVDPHKLALSRAQDRFMRTVRLHLRQTNTTEEDLEQRLGYRRYGLTRKLNGQELMTMRDVLRISEVMPAALASLAADENELQTVAELQPVFRKTKRAASPLHESLQTAVDALRDAADHVVQSGSARDADFGPALLSLSELVNDMGRAIAGRSTRR
jgi:hypothetical protein